MLFYALTAIAAGLGLGWIWLRFSPNTGGGSLLSARLQVLGQTKLSRTATLALIQVAGHSFIVGAHPHGMQLLARVDTDMENNDPMAMPRTLFGRKLEAAVERPSTPLERAFSRSRKRAFTLSGYREIPAAETKDPLIALAEATPAVLDSKNKA